MDENKIKPSKNRIELSPKVLQEARKHPFAAPWAARQDDESDEMYDRRMKGPIGFIKTYFDLGSSYDPDPFDAVFESEQEG